MRICKWEKVHHSMASLTFRYSYTVHFYPCCYTIVVWLCGKIRQRTNMYIHSFLRVHVACVCSTINYAATPLYNHSGGNIRLVLPVGIVVCRELPSHIIQRLYIHPYLVSSCFYAIPIFLIPHNWKNCLFTSKRLL